MERRKASVDEYMIFAERLTTEMERQELSYRQLAEKMGITVTTLFRYAKGQRVPKATEIVKASRALGVTCDYLIGLSDDPHKTSQESVYHPVSVNADLISRQQAIEAVEKSMYENPHENAILRGMHDHEHRHFLTILMGLPSAQPISFSRSHENDVISRQAAIDAFGLSEKTRKYGCDHSGYDTRMLYEIQNILEDLPSAQPEIIHCRECKYAEVADPNDNQDGYTCQFHRGSIWFSGSYCSWAERREDATN